MACLQILFVEDNDDLRAIFGEMIEEAGHEVVTCADAESALAVWQTRHFDALFTDISLPGMSGTELTRRVLAADPLRWVVWCSGYEYRDAVADFGPHVRVLSKVFGFDELDALASEIVQARDGADAA